jgi:hypothetical protein
MIHRIAAAFSATALASLSAAAQGAHIDYDKIQFALSEARLERGS